MHFDFHNPYAGTRLPVFARNLVSTSHPLAAQAGLRMPGDGAQALRQPLVDDAEQRDDTIGSGHGRVPPDCGSSTLPVRAPSVPAFIPAPAALAPEVS